VTHRPIPPSAGSEDLLTVTEVLTVLRVPRATFYRWRQLRIGPTAIKLPNGQLRVRRADLTDWVHTHTDRRAA
jgi:predicted DNA-binding transcriptional regulator AlpA